MTISAVSAPRIVYSGSGTLGPFSVAKGGVAITFSDNSHIQVTRFASATAQSGTVLAEDTDYTLTGGPDAGVVTLISPAQAVLASTERLLIERIQPKSQPLDLAAGGNFSSSAIEARHDREVEMIAESWDRAERSLEVHFGDGSMKMLPPKSQLANNLLGFDENGDPTVGDLSGVSDLVGLLDDITIVAAADVDIGTVADNIADVNTVADDIANVNLVGGAIDDGTIADLLDGQIGKVDTLAALKAYTSPVDDQVTFMAGRLVAGDAGLGLFRYTTDDLSSTLTPLSVTTTTVDSGTDTLTQTAHGLYTGQAVYPTTTANGLTASTFYYVIRTDANDFQLATSYENALDGTQVDLTGTDNITLKRHVDPREGFYVILNGAAIDGSEGAFVRQVAGDEISPTLFGATTSASDNSAAFAAAANLRTPVSVSIPDGTWNFTRPVMWDARVVTWKGRSKHTTILQWDADVNGLYGGSEGPLVHSGIEDVSFLISVAAASGEAVFLTFTAVNSLPSGIYRNIIIRGTGYPDTHAVKWWEYGLHLHNAVVPHIENITASGSTGESIADISRANAAIYLTADDAAVAPKIRNCFLSNWNSGIKIRTSSNPAIEGTYIDHVDAILCNVGIDVINSHASYIVPQIFITNCEFECLFNTIYLEGYSDGVIDHILSYLTNFGDTSPAHVHLKNCANISADKMSIISRSNNTNAKGVIVEDCDRIDIENSVISTQAAHILFSGTTQNSNAHAHLRFEGTGAETSDTSSNAATNKIGRDFTASAWWHWEGDVLKQGGYYSANTDANGDISVTYPKAFNTAFMPVVCNGAGGISTAPATLVSWNATGFVCRFPGDTSVPRTVNWMAAGI